MNTFTRLLKWLEKKPLILLRFDDGFEEVVQESKRGTERFTIALRRTSLQGLKLPTLCLAEIPFGHDSEFFVGVVASKTAVTTFDSRLTILRLRPINLPSLASLAASLARRGFQTAFDKKLAEKQLALGLTPSLSVAIVEALADDPSNRQTIEDAASNILSGQDSVAKWEQSDAIKMALAAFGLRKVDVPDFVQVPAGSDSNLSHMLSDKARALEDNVIAKDASVLPGFALIEKHVTGRAVFTRGDERLEVYTANRGPLETLLGVDLIYVNHTVGNIVMVQYKMLEAQRDNRTAKGDWVFRPDQQLNDEISRMMLPLLNEQIDDYRVHRDPFFFKFVKRTGNGKSHQSFIITLDHLKQLLISAKSKGPKGGIRVSYKALDGAYLREFDLIGLIRSGYVGTHRLESAALEPIISAVAEGNRALVLAWQSRIKKPSKP